MHEETFEWDDDKAESNYRKYAVDFETATDVFADIFAIEQVDLSAHYSEDRFLITGWPAISC